MPAPTEIARHGTYSVSEVAKVLRVGWRRVRQMVDAGQLDARDFAGATRITGVSLLRLLGDLEPPVDDAESAEDEAVLEWSFAGLSGVDPVTECALERAAARGDLDGALRRCRRAGKQPTAAWLELMRTRGGVPAQ